MSGRKTRWLAFVVAAMAATLALSTGAARAGLIVIPTFTADKTDAPDPVLVGGTLTYTATFTKANAPNFGSVSFTDPLPASMTFGSAVASIGTCSESGGTVTCGPVAMDTDPFAWTITIVVTPTVPGSITNNGLFIPTIGPNSLAASETTCVVTSFYPPQPQLCTGPLSPIANGGNASQSQALASDLAVQSEETSSGGGIPPWAIAGVVLAAATAFALTRVTRRVATAAHRRR